MYQQSTQVSARRGAGARFSSRRERGGQRNNRQSRERTRLIQLAVCLALFLTVFVGKGVFPGRLLQLRNQVLELISSDFDFQEAFSQLGESLAGGDTVLSDLGEFCVQVFGGESLSESAEPVIFQPPQPASVLTAELTFLSGTPDQLERTVHYGDLTRLDVKLEPTQEVKAAQVVVSDPEPVVPAVGTVVLAANYTGQPLPENYTMDQLSLGELDTVTPVLGHLNSVYGYRDHPVDGRYQFHGGVDIGGQTGDPIAAFAAGTVEYVGRDDSYGLYFQIDHGNGVKSFYAHCSQVGVSKGQSVEKGETVAWVGSTGTATGPHLHLELKYNKMHLNPAYYIDFLEEK